MTKKFTGDRLSSWFGRFLILINNKTEGKLIVHQKKLTILKKKPALYLKAPVAHFCSATIVRQEL